MKATIIIWFVLATCAIGNTSWAQCPEDANDKGTCDTLYVEPYDSAPSGTYPTDLQVALYYTHDVPDPTADSISGFTIPLCYTSSNAAANAFINPNKNNLQVSPFLPEAILNNSIFQHLPDMATATEVNFMMDYAAQVDEYGVPLDWDWDTKVLDLGTQNGVVDSFRLCIVITGTPDKGFGPGSRVLLATMTFTLDDTTTLCIDSCFWPPTARLQCSNADASVFIPRHLMPFCFKADTSGGHVLPGDLNSDGVIDLGDVVYLVSYLYRSGSPPNPPGAGDVNCDGLINVGDIVYLVNYLFKGGPPPCEP